MPWAPRSACLGEEGTKTKSSNSRSRALYDSSRLCFSSLIFQSCVTLKYGRDQSEAAFGMMEGEPEPHPTSQLRGLSPDPHSSEHSLTITAVRCAASQIPYLDLVSINKTGTLPWQPDCLFKLPLIDPISRDRLCLLNAESLSFNNKSLNKL